MKDLRIPLKKEKLALVQLEHCFIGRIFQRREMLWVQFCFNTALVEGKVSMAQEALYGFYEPQTLVFLASSLIKKKHKHILLWYRYNRKYVNSKYEIQVIFFSWFLKKCNYFPDILKTSLLKWCLIDNVTLSSLLRKSMMQETLKLEGKLGTSHMTEKNGTWRR